jgi:hypothetical protein
MTISSFTRSVQFVMYYFIVFLVQQNSHAAVIKQVLNCFDSAVLPEAPYFNCIFHVRINVNK